MKGLHLILTSNNSEAPSAKNITLHGVNRTKIQHISQCLWKLARDHVVTAPATLYWLVCVPEILGGGL